LGAVETMRIVEELMEIWPNEVCDILKKNIFEYLRSASLKMLRFRDEN